MSLQAGRLRHRIEIEDYTETQDTTTGAMTRTWGTFATVWASIEPMSVKEFVASQVEQSKVSLRILIRYLDGVKPEMRIYHSATGRYYQIEGILTDKQSGLEYMTLPCSILENA